MNLPFTNMQLYPSDECGQDEEFTESEYADVDEMLENLNADNLIDTTLDKMLAAAEITFDNPLHMVGYINRENLLELIYTYGCEYFDTVEPYYFCRQDVRGLTTEQLRKLALWLYDQLGGTQCE